MVMRRTAVTRAVGTPVGALVTVGEGVASAAPARIALRTCPRIIGTLVGYRETRSEIS